MAQPGVITAKAGIQLKYKNTLFPSPLYGERVVSAVAQRRQEPGEGFIQKQKTKILFRFFVHIEPLTRCFASPSPRKGERVTMFHLFSPTPHPNQTHTYRFASNIRLLFSNDDNVLQCKPWDTTPAALRETSTST